MPHQRMVPQPSLSIFDLDGTLLDTLGDISLALQRTLEKHGLGVPQRDAIARMVGDGARRLLSRATGRPVEDMDELLATFLAEYAADPTPETRVMPGTVALLDALAARRIPAVVCTNKPGPLARAVIERTLGARIERTLGGGDTARLKPHPEPILALLGGHAPSRVWMVGDGAQDILAARAAGVTAIGVRGGYGDISGAELVVSNLDELIPYLG